MSLNFVKNAHHSYIFWTEEINEMTIDIHYSTKITHPSNKRVVIKKLATVTYISRGRCRGGRRYDEIHHDSGWYPGSNPGFGRCLGLKSVVRNVFPNKCFFLFQAAQAKCSLLKIVFLLFGMRLATSSWPTATLISWGHVRVSRRVLWTNLDTICLD